MANWMWLPLSYYAGIGFKFLTPGAFELMLVHFAGSFDVLTGLIKFQFAMASFQGQSVGL